MFWCEGAHSLNSKLHIGFPRDPRDEGQGRLIICPSPQVMDTCTTWDVEQMTLAIYGGSDTNTLPTRGSSVEDSCRNQDRPLQGKLVTLTFTCAAAPRQGRLPKHLLRMPKDLTSGAFYSHSSLGAVIFCNWSDIPLCRYCWCRFTEVYLWFLRC